MSDIHCTSGNVLWIGVPTICELPNQYQCLYKGNGNSFLSITVLPLLVVCTQVGQGTLFIETFGRKVVQIRWLQFQSVFIVGSDCREFPWFSGQTPLVVAGPFGWIFCDAPIDFASGCVFMKLSVLFGGLTLLIYDASRLGAVSPTG